MMFASWWSCLAIIVAASVCAANNTYVNDENDQSRMLLVLSAPKKNDWYYHEEYQNILEFQVNYALEIMNKDNIVVMGDADALEYFRQQLPEEILLPMTTEDIWMRDFTPINGVGGSVFFQYSRAAQGGSQYEADRVQRMFKEALLTLNVSFPSAPYIMDGGLAVMNFKGKVVVTNKFLEDNWLYEHDAVDVLKAELGMDEVAVIMSDDPSGLAHTDGMLMFVQENEILLNNYGPQFPLLRAYVKPKLVEAFPETDIVLTNFSWTRKTPSYDDDFLSACGIYVNSVYTHKFIYMPTFNNATFDEPIYEQFKQEAGDEREVIKVAAENVCSMGGSVRCLTWQLEYSPQATKLIQAARTLE